jgi:hypothetical protein
VRLLGDDAAPADAARLRERYEAAQIKIDGALARAKGGVESVLTLSNDPAVSRLVAELGSQLTAFRALQAQKLQARLPRPAPASRALSAEEQEAARLVPAYRYKFYSEDYRTRAEGLPKLLAALPAPRLSGQAASEAVRFVDGRRSVLDIYRLVRAEYGNVTTSSNEFKFAYVVTPDTPDIALAAVAAHLRALEQAGLVEMIRK